MLAKKELLGQLRDMGVPQDRPVLVHISLRAVGEVEERADGFLDTLIEHVTADGGLLCIPTHTWANLKEPDKITLDLRTNETCIGTLPTVAAGRADAYRTSHPTHSMAIFGDREAAIAFGKDEDDCITPAPANGCFGKICDRDGYILLIGVGHDRNTYLHSVDEMLKIPNRLSEQPKQVTVCDRSGRVSHRLMYSHRGGVHNFYPKYEPAFRHHGVITDGMIGNARAQLCSASEMRRIAALIRERSGGVELFADDLPIDPRFYL